MKKLFIVFLLLGILSFIPQTFANASSANFNDVSQSNVYYNEIKYLKDNNIANGYSNGDFGVNDNIKRNEFIKILISSKFSQVDINTCKFNNPTAAFLDVPSSDVFSSYICVAKSRNIVNGYSNGTFKPNDYVSYPEAAKILVRTLYDFNLPDSSSLETYTAKLNELNLTPPTVTQGIVLNNNNQHIKLKRGEMADLIYGSKVENPTGLGKINPANFTTSITNPYMTLTPGNKWIYESNTEDEEIKIETYVTDETKVVMGVTTVVVWDREWIDGELAEDTYDWYAQDNEGNVWYFGEDTKELVGGQVVSTEGSWEAGVNNAKPGIVMKGNPKIGDEYYQEFLAGEAEDKGKVLSLSASVEIDYGTFPNCIKIKDFTPLDSSVEEHKYFCQETKGVALIIDLEDNEKEELVSFEVGADPTEETEEESNPEPIQTEITEAEGIEIAKGAVPDGIVGGVGYERKFGRTTLVVEMQSSSQGEIDVIIDVATGEILALDD